MRSGPPSSAPGVTTRRSTRLLVHPRFGPFFFGKLLSTVGIWIHNIGAAILVHDLTGSALMVGMVSVSQFLPLLVLTPWSGARADSGNRGTQMVVGRFVGAAGSLGLALWIYLLGVEGTGGAFVVIVAGLVVGVGFAIGLPAMHALIPALVAPEDLADAVAWGSMTFTVGRTVGPALGALAAAGLGPGAAFALAAAGNLVFGVIVVAMRISSTGTGATGRTVRAGLRYLRTERTMVALLIGIATVGVGADPVLTLTPTIADKLGGDAGLVGALVSAFGVGAAGGFSLVGPVRRRIGIERVGTIGLAAMAASLLALAVCPNAASALVVLAVGGVGMTFAVPGLTTQIQQRVPEELRGRVMSVWTMAFLGCRPVAALVNGRLADTVSVEAALVVVAGVLVGGIVITERVRRGH